MGNICAATAYNPETSTWMGYHLTPVESSTVTKDSLDQKITVEFGSLKATVAKAVWDVLSSGSVTLPDIEEDTLKVELPEQLVHVPYASLSAAFQRVRTVFDFCETHFERVAPSADAARVFLSTVTLAISTETPESRAIIALEKQICEIFGIVGAFAFDVTDLEEGNDKFVYSRFLSCEAKTADEALENPFTAGGDTFALDTLRNRFNGDLAAVGTLLVAQSPKIVSRESIQKEVIALAAKKEAAMKTAVDQTAQATTASALKVKTVTASCPKLVETLASCPTFIQAKNPFVGVNTEYVKDEELEATAFTKMPETSAMKSELSKWTKANKKTPIPTMAAEKKQLFAAWKAEHLAQFELKKAIAVIEDEKATALKKIDAEVASLQSQIYHVPVYNFNTVAPKSTDDSVFKVLAVAMGNDKVLNVLAFRHGLFTTTNHAAHQAFTVLVDRLVKVSTPATAAEFVRYLLTSAPITNVSRFQFAVSALSAKFIEDDHLVASFLPTVIACETRYGNKLFRFDLLAVENGEDAATDLTQIPTAELEVAIVRKVLEPSSLALFAELDQVKYTLSKGVTPKTSTNLLTHLAMCIPLTVDQGPLTIGQLQNIAALAQRYRAAGEEENMEGALLMTADRTLVYRTEEYINASHAYGAQVELFCRILTGDIEVPQNVMDLVCSSKTE